MKRGLGVVVAAIAALGGTACGPEPMDVSGPWSGASNLFVTTGETLSGNEGVSVTQQGGDISFFLAGCVVEASASSESSFDIDDFECQKQVNSKLWTLYGKGGSRITASGNNFNMSLLGDAESGEEKTSFQWTFNGSRAQ